MPFVRAQSFLRSAAALGASAVVALTTILTVRAGQQAPGMDLKIELATSIGDGFTLATVGDCIIARPISKAADAGLTGAGKLLHEADATFGNFEGSAIDIRHFNGYPQAEYGGMWLIGIPEVAADLRFLGFTLMSRANNHTTDWGVEGMRTTDAALDKAGIVHAGSGENRAEAMAPRYVDTPKGRVGIVSMASSYTPISRAMSPLGEAPGRPGLNALRTRRYALVTPEMMSALRKIRDAQPKESLPPPAGSNESADELTLFGVSYKTSDHVGFSYKVDPIDQRDILKSIRQGKENSDFMIATIHAHDPGNWSQEPPDFLQGLAHGAIDNGADAFVGHGPHQLRGIEIYKGKPIFYSLGNFFFEIGLQEPVALDMYELMIDQTSQTDAEPNEVFRARNFTGDVWYQSVVATSRYQGGQLAEIRLHPVDLGYSMRAADRGVPRVTSPQVAVMILERLQRLSKPFGTTIDVEQNVGVIRLRSTAPTQARP